MFVKNSYIGTTRGTYKCLFFLLIEDYIEIQSQFFREINPLLERFSRKLAENAPLIRSFEGDIEETRKQILDKSWSDRAKKELMKTPGLLMINENFDDFDPKVHPWIYLNFGQKFWRETSSVTCLNAYDNINMLLNKLADIVDSSGTDIFKNASKLNSRFSVKDITSIIEVKPGIFGISINLIRGLEVIKKLLKGE